MTEGIKYDETEEFITDHIYHFWAYKEFLIYILYKMTIRFCCWRDSIFFTFLKSSFLQVTEDSTEMLKLYTSSGDVFPNCVVIPNQSRKHYSCVKAIPHHGWHGCAVVIWVAQPSVGV